MTNAVTQNPGSVGQDIASGGAPDHVGVPFIEGFDFPFPDGPAGVITDYLDCEQVINLAAANDSPFKDNAVIQKTAAVWHSKLPDKCNTTVEDISKREAEAEAAAQTEQRRRLTRIASVFMIISMTFFFIGIFVIFLAFTYLSINLALLVTACPFLLFFVFLALFAYFEPPGIPS